MVCTTWNGAASYTHSAQWWGDALNMSVTCDRELDSFARWIKNKRFGFKSMGFAVNDLEMSEVAKDCGATWILGRIANAMPALEELEISLARECLPPPYVELEGWCLDRDSTQMRFHASVLAGLPELRHVAIKPLPADIT